MAETAKIPIKKRKFLALYLGTNPKYAGNAQECALKIYNCKDKDSARSLGSQVLSTLNIPLRKIMAAKGIDDDSLMAELAEGIAAEEIKVSTHEGKFIYSKSLKNLSMSEKNRELAHRLRGDLTNTLKLELPPEVSINIDSHHVPVATEPESTG